MITRPFPSENQHIWLEEQKLRLQKLAEQQQATAEPEKRRLKELHWMHCPKCGPMEIDVCPCC